ncbi:unnamed protein product [Paramecium sonneborni]|uniref:Uncharacterized protein n=1 Tax=Paramecium sonneborni TaxID=65129 RepID=A0A8S1RTV7_9CILI|nr:unnamed protein product [Paramecium sonneborni]
MFQKGLVLHLYSLQSKFKRSYQHQYIYFQKTNLQFFRNSRNLFRQIKNINVIQKRIVETESVDEYVKGVWIRLLIAFLKLQVVDQIYIILSIFRFSSTRQYQDKSDLENKILSTFLTKSSYEFITYDTSKPVNAVDGQLPYDSIEREWTYVQTVLKMNILWNDIVQRTIQGNPLTLDVTHQVLIGYAHFFLGVRELGQQFVF